MVQKSIKLKIFANFNAFYYSFYYLGISQVFSKGEIIFVNCNELPFKHSEDLFAFITPNNKNCIIDAMDTPKINDQAAEWCDVYGKVNFLSSAISNSCMSKVLPIGPSFGIRVWENPAFFLLALSNYFKSKEIIHSKRNFFANYYRQYKYRLAEESYKPISSSDHYVFSVNSIWKKDFQANIYRSNFIKACRTIENIEFEGGFAPRSKNDVSGFSDLTISNRYPFDEYLQKTKLSMLVFNTPAVEQCHGWKLGEFLAMGKAIVSTPLSRGLPAPLVHGKNVFFVDGTEQSIIEAITTLARDKHLRQELEFNSRLYYETYLAPKKVIEKVINFN